MAVSHVGVAYLPTYTGGLDAEELLRVNVRGGTDRPRLSYIPLPDIDLSTFGSRILCKTIDRCGPA